MKKLFTLFCVAVCTCQISWSQELYVGASAEFYLKKNTDFTTSNTIVTTVSSGIFSVEAGTNWGSVQEYVNGEVLAYGTGITKLPIGNNGVYAPVMADHTGDIEGTYFNAPPPSGSNGTDVDAVSAIEYWELTGNAVITLPWIAASDITSLVNNNGGVLNSVAIVGLNGGVWDLVSAPKTNTVTGNLTIGDVTSDNANQVNLNAFTQFTFGIDHQATLGIEDLFLTNNITIISNPIRAIENNIQFTASNDLTGLEVSLYDLRGRELHVYKNISINNGIGNLEKPKIQSGIYILKFSQEGKQGIKKIIIE